MGNVGSSCNSGIVLQQPRHQPFWVFVSPDKLPHDVEAVELVEYFYGCDVAIFARFFGSNKALLNISV